MVLPSDETDPSCDQDVVPEVDVRRHVGPDAELDVVPDGHVHVLRKGHLRHDADEAPVSDPGELDMELPPGTGLVQAVPQRESRPAFAIHEIGILDHNVPSSFRMRSRPESKEYKA